MTKLPSTAQMLSRMNYGHAEIMMAIRDQALTPGLTTVSLAFVRNNRGGVLTLTKWECIKHGQLTKRGTELLNAYYNNGFR